MPSPLSEPNTIESCTLVDGTPLEIARLIAPPVLVALDDGRYQLHLKLRERQKSDPQQESGRIYQAEIDKLEIDNLPAKEGKQLYRQLSLLFYQHHFDQAEQDYQQLHQMIPRGCYPLISELRAIKTQAYQACQRFQLPPENGLVEQGEEQTNKHVFNQTFCKPFNYIHRWAHASDEQLATVQQRFVTAEVGRYQSLFEQIESSPLTKAQCIACVTQERNNLVVAGAGTGKTSTMVGRAGYLITSQRAQPEQILMLAFARKAADEMRERLTSRLGKAASGIASFTFHALGRYIIQQVEGRPPAISPMAEDQNTRRGWVEECFNHLLSTEDDFQQKALHYFAHYLYPGKEPFDFQHEVQHRQYLLDNRIFSLKGETVASLPEALLANWLFRNSIKYCYQYRYSPEQRRPDHRIYEATFYLPELDAWVDFLPRNSKGKVPVWMNQRDQETNWQWLERFHRREGNHWYCTDYQQWQQGTLITGLAQWLLELGVEPDPLPGKAVLDTLNETGATRQMAELLHDMLSRARGGRFDRTGFEPLISNATDPKRMRAALELLQPVLVSYQQALDKAGHIDFDEMVSRAIEHVRSGLFQSPWQQILVDEFQDISRPRAELIRALQEQNPQTHLFCVGDDWQAIYRFAGSDLHLTTAFTDQFGDTATTVLDKTFRFNNSIGAIASRFVMSNPDQLRKSLSTQHQVDFPAVSLLRMGYSSKTRLEPIKKALRALSLQAESGSTVYLLGRYLYNLPDHSELAELREQFPQLQISPLSMHASKGREADYTLILELVSGKNGFPSQKESHPLLEAMLPGVDAYLHAEERRLFYVALTRARHRAILLTDMTRPSEFIEELLNNNYLLDRDSFPSTLTQQLGLSPGCPQCMQGTLLERQGRRGRFYGCSHYPKCDHSEPACGLCGAPMELDTDSEVRICLNPACHHTEPACPACNSAMTLKEGRNGEFWGCSQYRRDDPHSCKATKPA
ncbi:MAG: UvrD-helicase domain-containing protein [Marinobacterium sp.]|nr:UvrD-helicase domain-containing protein [Marinobacterium sp.]